MLVLDTSAWVVFRRALREAPNHQLVSDFRSGLVSGQLRGCDIVKLEMLHNARNPAEFLALEQRMDGVPTLPITSAASRAAVGALRDLSKASTPGSPTGHRVGHGDVLVAAIAAEYGFDVLHHDHHFDQLSSVLSFDSVRIAGGYNRMLWMAMRRKAAYLPG